MSNGLNQNSDRSFGSYRGNISPQFDEPGFIAQLGEIHRLVDSSGAHEITHGRNRVVRVQIEALDLAVKRFGPQLAWKDRIDRKRGSGARRSWLAATALQLAKVGTPTPVAFCERWEGGSLVESYFITYFLQDTVSFKDALLHLYYDEPMCENIMSLLDCVSSGVRNMHEAGFQHNDLGNQNILLASAGDGYWCEPRFVDLNRGRLCKSLTDKERARDISRITLPSDLLRAFIDKYFGVVPSEEFIRWQKHYRRRYAWHSMTRRWRHPFREASVVKKVASEIKYPAPKDFWIWDDRSAQAIGALLPGDKKRQYPVSRHFRIATDTLHAAPGVWATYRHVLDECFRNDVLMDDRIGVWIEPTRDRAEREMALLSELGKVPVMLRLYHHETAEQRGYRLAVAKEMHKAGHKVGVAMVQDRSAVRNPSKWAEFLRRSISEIRDVAEIVEIGHTINRVKWGAWSMREVRSLLAPLSELIHQYPQITFMGPACIDFEFPFLVSALKQLPDNARFAALSHQLYVDRRGAPENRQSGFSALEKFALARAIARWSASCEDRLIVSEVNWPIVDTGEYSPVGSPYESPGGRLNDPSVTEDQYADYMLRYICMAICSGLVERVYWWRLVARGFGLVDDTDTDNWRKRPAFEMLKEFLKKTDGKNFPGSRLDPPCLPRSSSLNQGLVDTPDGRATRYTFERRSASGNDEIREADRLELVYCAEGNVGLEQLLKGRESDSLVATDAFGQRLDQKGLCVGGRPVYLEWV
jgi:tRNA A-37 threonylcarbamoyl transferase component Bud32